MKYSLSFLAFVASLSLINAGEFSSAKQPTDVITHSTLGFDTHRVDSHAPIGVMGDHTHEAGEVMLSYRYMRMDMRPNYVGSDTVLPQQVATPPGGGEFRITPTNMQTEMQMIGAMVAPTDDLTLMFMLPVLDRAMDHLIFNGTTFRTHSQGIGDFRFGGLINLFETESMKGHLNLGLSAPTGSITETGSIPVAPAPVRLPYPMQLGSGTWDLHPGVTVLGQNGDFSWGAQALGVVRLGTNDEGYSLGNEFNTTGWVALRLSDNVSTSLRLAYRNWGNIDGQDPRISGPVPTARPDLRGGQRIDAFYGVNYLATDGALSGFRVAAEVGRELWQDLDGPQLGMDWMFILGVQKSW
ncbi:MAG: transporter [Verrucomicrobiota bacterium]